jgi:hypothetical protein
MTDMSDTIGHRDVLYLFACLLEWHTERKLAAYHELIAALDDQDENIRYLAEGLLIDVSHGQR